MKKKQKEEINEKLYKQSKMMLVSFIMLGVLMVSVILINATIAKGTYSADPMSSCSCSGANGATESICNKNGGTWQCTDSGTGTSQTCADLGMYSSCPDYYICDKTTTNGISCYSLSRKKTCEELNSSWSATCPSNWYCGNNTNNYGCYEKQCTIGESCGTGKKCTDTGCKDVYAYFYTWDGQTYITKCKLSEIGTCEANSTCTQWATSTYKNTGTATGSITSEGNYYCAAGSSVHEGCCKNNSGVVQSYNNLLDCEANGFNWTCVNSTPIPTATPTNTPTSTPKPTTTPTNTPTSTPTLKPSQTPTTTVSCYACTSGSKTQYVYATNATNAAAGATISGVTASSCTLTADSNCKGVNTEGCYECVSGTNTKHVNATSAEDAKTKTGYSTCTAVEQNKCNTNINPKTGTIGIIIAWSIGLFAIAYSFWYFRQTLSVNK